MLDTRGRFVNIVMYIPLEYFIISYYTEYIMKCEQLPSPWASVRLQSFAVGGRAESHLNFPMMVIVQDRTFSSFG